MSNVFEKFGQHESTHFIKSLGAEVTIRKLTLKESEEFMDRMYKGEDSAGEAIIDMTNMSAIILEKVCLALIEPKVTVEEFQAMDADVTAVVMEIHKLIDKSGELDEEGKLD